VVRAEVGASGLVFRAQAGGERKAMTHNETIERRMHSDGAQILELEAYLAANDGLRQVGTARDIAELFAAGNSEFVTGVLRFRWARTHDVDVVADAIKKQMIEFLLDRDANDDAGMLSVPVQMGGSLEKCVSRKDLHDGNFSPTSHLATFLRQLGHGVLPLGFFAQLQPMSKLIYLKPYAIWFP
jgi:hypothetical protein